jgi:signal transduction histidine kinase
VLFDWKYIESILNNTRNQGSAAALLDENAAEFQELAQTPDWKKITAAHDISVRSIANNLATPPIFNWHVAITQYRSVVMAPVHRMGYIFIFLLIVTAFLATVLAAPLARSITKPLARLTDYANRFMRSSQGALPPVDGPVEVRALSNAFGKMMEDLALSKENLTRAAKLAVAGEMAAAMSHEIRTPLGILRSSAQVLEREKNLSAEGLEVVAFITTETERLNKLVSTLVDSARPRQPEFAMHDMVGLLEHTVAMLRMQANKKDISLALVIKDLATANALLVECDGEQITQVILNLLLNAIQVLPTGGKVVVSLSETADHVTISVADNGGGVSEAQKEQIFDPFFTQRPGGIGLGLAVSKQIVTAHFGSLAVEKSTLAETGADFIVRLPKRQLHE